MLYTTTQIAENLNIQYFSCWSWIRKLNLIAEKKEDGQYYYSEDQMLSVCNSVYKEREKFLKPERVIYVHSTYHIYESKINFLNDL